MILWPLSVITDPDWCWEGLLIDDWFTRGKPLVSDRYWLVIVTASSLDQVSDHYWLVIITVRVLFTAPPPTE